jgi:hypothetical protein
MKNSRILIISSACAFLMAFGAAFAHDSGIAFARDKHVAPAYNSYAAAVNRANADWSANISDDDLSSAALGVLTQSPNFPDIGSVNIADEPELKADEEGLAKLRAWTKSVHPDRVRRAYLHWIDYTQGEIKERRAELALYAHIQKVEGLIPQPPKGK